MRAPYVRTPVPRLAAAAAVGALGLVLAPGAGAAGCQGAPGTSALEQYCEAIPDASGGRDNPGDRSQRRASGTSGASQGSGMPRGTETALSRRGADGAAVATLAGARASATQTSSGKRTASKPASSSNSEAGASQGGQEIAPPTNPSNSPLKAATKAAGSGPTVGAGLVWGLLAMSAVGAAGAVVLRRHAPVLDEDQEES